MSTIRRIDAVERTITEKFSHMKENCHLYWDVRDALTENKFQLGWNEFAYRQDKGFSGHKEAWEDFGSNILPLQQEVDFLEKKYGSLEVGFTKIKLDLLVDTDAIINQAFSILKQATNAQKLSDILPIGRKIFGLPPKYSSNDDTRSGNSYVPVKDLIWYGRNQANHYMDNPGQAVKKLNEFKEIFLKNLQEWVHADFCDDLLNYFLPQKKISMSDEILKLLNWRSFEDFKKDLVLYEKR